MQRPSSTTRVVSGSTTPNKANIWALRKSTSSLPSSNTINNSSSTPSSGSWIRESSLIIPSNIPNKNNNTKAGGVMMINSDQQVQQKPEQDTLSILNDLANQSSPLPITKSSSTLTPSNTNKSSLTTSTNGVITPNKTSFGGLKKMLYNKSNDENVEAPTHQGKTPNKTPSKKVSFELVTKKKTPSVLQPQNPNIIPQTITKENLKVSPEKVEKVVAQPAISNQGEEKFSFTVFSTITQKNYKILIKYKDVNKLKVYKIKSNLHRVVNVPVEEQVLYASVPTQEISVSKPLEDHVTGSSLSLSDKTVLILVHISQRKQYENQIEKRQSPNKVNQQQNDEMLLEEEQPRPPKTPSPNKLTSPSKQPLQHDSPPQQLSSPNQPYQNDSKSPSPIAKQLSPKLSSSQSEDRNEEYDLDDSFINSFINPTRDNEATKTEPRNNMSMNTSSYIVSFSSSPPRDSVFSPRFKMSDVEAEREKTIRMALEKHFQNQMNDEKLKLSRKYASEKKEILQKANEDRQELMTENTRLRKELLSEKDIQKTPYGTRGGAASEDITKLKQQLAELQASIRERDGKIVQMENSATQLKNELVQESQVWRNKFEIEKQVAWNREKDTILRNWAEEIEILKLVQQQERIESQNIIDQIETELEVANQKIESDKKFVDSAEYAIENLKNQIGKLMRGDYDTASLIMEAAKERALIEKRYNDLYSDYNALRNLFEEEVKKRKSLHNLVEDMKGNIRVIVRMRPLIGDEQATDLSNGRIDIKDDTTITVGSQNLGLKEYDFFKVLDENISQEDVFEHVKPMLQSALDGYNLCIFAYGQTGSGKTFTIHGEDQSNQCGLIQRTADYLFYSLEKQMCSRTEAFSISCSMVELYLDTLNDLFEKYQDSENQFKATDKRKPPQLRQSKNGKMSVTNCIEVDVYHPNDLVRLLEFGNEVKQISKTDMNDQSSRSHTIFTIKISMEGYTQPTSLNPQGRLFKKESKIAFVDLAGSERVSRSNSIGDRFKEAQHINKSLSALGDVIAALSTHQKHIPYRNSKLTLMLQDMIGGNSKTLMFANVSPDKKSVSETISTLTFASRVKCVKNHPMLSRQIVTDEN
ncbi:kinesin-14 [Naegleria gruberi]|uniref:Kinesin-14 n=1 Tax=Naegleria gruberi TaxID=5762 RepID=D2VBF5_NAEGR|nr:kinesin-14 [Naegleria gruberi]EFC45899.1 kinesin-14 [Naegleria gruberi]|eukprot:XP_002678643.1 kinesin-14 [Naegleria gruberi]